MLCTHTLALNHCTSMYHHTTILHTLSLLQHPVSPPLSHIHTHSLSLTHTHSLSHTTHSLSTQSEKYYLEKGKKLCCSSHCGYRRLISRNRLLRAAEAVCPCLSLHINSSIYDGSISSWTPFILLNFLFTRDQ